MPEPIFTEVRGEPLSNVALKAIREAIVNGRLASGQTVNQAEVAKQLGISRAPLREALRQLETEGLVTNVPFHGAVVTPLRLQDVQELQSFRRLLELFAAELMLRRCNDQDLDVFDGVVDEMERHAAAGDLDGLNRADIRFHTQIIELSGHQLLVGVWQRYVQLIRRMLALRNQLNPDPRSLLSMHRDLVEAFRTRDLDRVRERYAVHGADLVTALTDLLGRDENSAAQVTADVEASSPAGAGANGNRSGELV